MFNLLQNGLLLHIIGLSALAGATVSGYVLLRQLQRDYKDRQKSIALVNVIKKISRIAGTGLGLQVVSGMMMLAATKGAFGQQLWFKIKMIIVLLVIVIIVALNLGMQKQLRKLVLNDVMDDSKNRQVAKITNRIKNVQVFLLGFFILIFILSVFRFN